MDAKRKLIKLKVRVVITENEFQKTKEQLERISKNIGSIGETEDWTEVAIKALENQQDITNVLHDKKKLCQHFANKAAKQERYARNVLKDEPTREDVKDDLNNAIKLQDRYNALIEFIDFLEDTYLY